MKTYPLLFVLFISTSIVVGQHLPFLNTLLVLEEDREKVVKCKFWDDNEDKRNYNTL